MGKGHGKVRLHSEIENACVSLAKCVRFNVAQQLLDLFASAIHVDRRREFLAAQRRHRTTHAGLVLDWVIKNFVRPGQPSVVPVNVLYDVKGISRPPYYYGPARLERVPDIRAAKVSGEYEKKALATDRGFNGQGVPGPVMLRLLAYPPVVRLAVGAYGEWSRTMGRFISDVAAKGSVRKSQSASAAATARSTPRGSSRASRARFWAERRFAVLLVFTSRPWTRLQ
jgi:hypothetical protein